jgi:hypothetical protein
MTQKILFTLASLLLSYTASFTQIFAEDFESGVPGSFTQNYLSGSVDFVENTNNGGGVSFPYNGSISASFYYNGYSAYSTELVSPSLDLSAGAFTLNFTHVQKKWGGDQNELAVYASNDDGSNWTLVARSSLLLTTTTVALLVWTISASLVLQVQMQLLLLLQLL